MAKRSSRSSRRRNSDQHFGSVSVAPVEITKKKQDLTDEYRYVINDLRNMALIALVLIAGLVALSFFL